VFTHAHVSMITHRVDVYLPTHHKPSAQMPGPEGPAHKGWLGVVTGIRLLHIIAATTAERHGGFLVSLMNASRAHAFTIKSMYNQCITIQQRYNRN